MLEEDDEPELVVVRWPALHKLDLQGGESIFLPHALQPTAETGLELLSVWPGLKWPHCEAILLSCTHLTTLRFGILEHGDSSAEAMAAVERCRELRLSAMRRLGISAALRQGIAQLPLHMFPSLFSSLSLTSLCLTDMTGVQDAVGRLLQSSCGKTLTALTLHSKRACPGV